MRVALVMLTVSCAPAPRPPELVVDDGWKTPSAGPRAATSAVHPRPLRPEERPAYPASVLEGLVEASGPHASEHLGGDLERTVWINEAASPYRHLLPTTTFPPGAVVVARHHPPDTDAIVAVYVMQKTAGGWSYAALDPALRRVSEAPLAACARCHAEAPYDGVFGPPAAP